MHLETLGEILDIIAGSSEDLPPFPQSSYLFTFLERLSRRDEYFGALQEKHLLTCSALLKCVLIDKEAPFITVITEENFARVEEILSRCDQLAQTQTTGVEADLEADAQNLITVREISRMESPGVSHVLFILSAI